MCGVEPLIPVDVEIGRHAIEACVERGQALVDQLRQLHELELVALLDFGHLGDGIVEPHGLSVDFGQRLIGPHLCA